MGRPQGEESLITGTAGGDLTSGSEVQEDQGQTRALEEQDNDMDPFTGT